MNRPKTKPEWIDTSNQLKYLLDILRQEPFIAVDTESDSLYSYYEKVCLIQFSTPQVDFLVDPLKVNVSDLASIFADESLQKIFHAAEYDILSLKRDYGFTFNNLFDTMLAARILGWNRYGLSALLQQHFGVQLDKRYQRYNWGRRPLSKDALNYARLDTHYLIELSKIQLQALKKQNRLREANEIFKRVTEVEPDPKEFNPDKFWRIKGSRDLLPYQQAILRELFIWRDKLARKLDRPPFKIINNSSLLELAKAPPTSQVELKQIKGLSENLVRHNGADILKAIQNGQADPLPPQPVNNYRPDEATLARYENLRQWRNHLAAKRGVEPDIIINNHTLMEVARQNPKSLKTLANTGILSDWQCETYGKSLLQVLRGL
jgi:ribonuclease D